MRNLRLRETKRQAKCNGPSPKTVDALRVRSVVTASTGGSASSLKARNLSPADASPCAPRRLNGRTWNEKIMNMKGGHFSASSSDLALQTGLAGDRRLVDESARAETLPAPWTVAAI